jgi:protease-4
MKLHLLRSSILAGAALLPALSPFASAADETVASKDLKVVQVTIKDVFEDVQADSPFGPQTRNLRERLVQLRELAADTSVAGVRLKVDGSPDHARALDLLEELRALKGSGKKIACYSETLSQDSLVFASLADHLVVPPSGLISLEGYTLELMYLKDLLAKLEIQAHVLHVGDFKTAFEELARDSMSAEQRKTIEDLLDEFFKQTVSTIAANRGVPEDKVLAAFDKVLLTPAEALEIGLIDAVAYEDEFDTQCETLFGGKLELDKEWGKAKSEDLEEMLESPFAMFKMLPMLLNPPGEKLPDGPRIAVVYATGAIASGKSQRGFDGSVTGMGSETIVEALDKALEDDWVRAVVFRVNSPGGSALASDMIWRATQRVKEKKPIIASMGGVAGSGGYWISMGCNEIMAQPSTITGSIGVVSMLPDLSRTMKNKLGINVEVVARGPHAAEMAMLRDGPSPFVKQLVTTMMEQVYREFLHKVAEGRHSNPELIDQVARGRVWTGRQAKEINLVDELGGLEDAIARACELANVERDAVHIVEYPKAPNFFEQLEEAFNDMAVARSPMCALLQQLGYAEAASVVDMLTSDTRPIHADRVQALMPFFMTVR